MSDVCIDLCCGLGGFSRAFVDAGWEVITVDIDPKFNPTVCLDITMIDWINFKANVLKGKTVQVLLASPPCEHFSIACHTWPRLGIKKGMQVVGACFEAVAVLKPERWLIENPMGRLRWFLGKPPLTLRLCDFGSSYKKLTDFWGNIPLPMVEGMRSPTHYVFTESKMNAKQPKPTKTSNREQIAKIPYGLSLAIHKTVKKGGF